MADLYSRRQQRDHQRRRLQRGVRLRRDLLPTAATSASSRAPGNAGTGNPGGGLICQYNTTQNIDRSSPAVGPVPRRRRRRHRHRRRQLLLRAPPTQTRSSPSTRLRPGVERHPERHHRRLARPRRRHRATASSTSWRAPTANTIYVLNGTNGAAVWSATTTRPGHRLAGHGRPDRRRLPGRHRPDHRTASTSSTDARVPT